MRVLVMSTVFPNRNRPTYGVFVRERVRHVAERCEAVVIAPVPWFPLNRLLRGAERATAPLVERDGAVTIYHPRVLCVPGVAKCLDGVLYFLSVLPFVAWLRRRFAFDLIDAHFTYPDGLAGVLLGRVFGRPVLLTVRGSHDQRHAAYRLRRPQIRFALRAADRVIAVSQSLASFAVDLGVSPDRVRVVPNGVDPDRFAPADRAAARASLGLPADGRILLAVGNLVEGKGHHRILDLLPRLVAERPDVLYVAVGGAPTDAYRRRLEAAVGRHQLGGHVRIVGPRPHEEMPRWMAAADLFCLATQAEGWCNAITEALACGLPVVTTRVGGNAEIVRDGIDGLLVPFWDADAFRTAIGTALDRRWDRPQISARARGAGWKRTADLVVREFDDVLAVDRPAAAGSCWSVR
ncbi:MAG: glycosyltransferase family 4 protein [Candidatus Rokuibacteriota bacterium]